MIVSSVLSCLAPNQGVKSWLCAALYVVSYFLAARGRDKSGSLQIEVLTCNSYGCRPVIISNSLILLTYYLLLVRVRVKSAATGLGF